MKRIIAGILAVLVLVGCGGRAEETPNKTINETAESTNIYAEDAQQLVYAVHAAHPVFVLDKVTPKYEAAEAEFLENAPNAEDKDEFALMVRKYMVSLDDEHTQPWADGAGSLENLTRCKLDLQCSYENGKLYIRNEDGTSSESYITAIQGVDIEHIFETVEEYYPFENSESKAFYYRNAPMYSGVLNYAAVILKLKAKKPRLCAMTRL